jgi:SAM-dependent methyltransferase
MTVRFNIDYYKKYTPHTLKKAVENNYIRNLMEIGIINGDFKAAPPEDGRRFFEYLVNIARSNWTESVQFINLREYYRYHCTDCGKYDLDTLSDKDTRMKFRVDTVSDLLLEVTGPGTFIPRTFLDIGSGDGRFTRGLQRAYPSIGQAIGVEVVKLSEDGFIPIIYDGLHLPFEDDKFDLITILTVLHHAKDPRVLLQEAYRVLKPGGKLVMRELGGAEEDPELHYKSFLFNLVMDKICYYVYKNDLRVAVPGWYLRVSDWISIFNEVGFKQLLYSPNEPKNIGNPYKPFIFILGK